LRWQRSLPENIDHGLILVTRHFGDRADGRYHTSDPSTPTVPFREVLTMLSSESRPPLPPFTLEAAVQKVRLAEDACDSLDPESVSLGYSPQSRWRNRAEFLVGREQIVAFLRRKWACELDYRLIKEQWTFRDNLIAVRFACESHDDSGNWFRSYG